MIYDVLIIGAGASGYGCAMTLASANDKFEWAKDKKYLLLDDDNSDIKKASFYNLSGVKYGIGGDDLVDELGIQLRKLKHCEVQNTTVTKISKENDIYIVESNNNQYEARIVVIATGMHKFDIQTSDINIEVLTNSNIMKPNKIYLKNENNLIKPNLYVAGLASGVKTMFAIANGDGVKVACDIFELWTNKKAVSHDSIKDAIK